MEGKKMIHYITKDDFEREVVNSDQPVVLDFFATWCGPCQAQGRILEKLDSLYEGKIKICKSNVDENPDFAEMFGVQTIPTLVFYKNGMKVAQHSGVLDKDEILRMFDR